MRGKRIATAVGWVLLAGVAGLSGYEAYAVHRARERTPEILAEIQASPGELRLAEVLAERIAMLLAVEDPGFRTHGGVDFSTPGQGLTTITQALVKQLYFPRFQPGFAKLEQSLIAALVLDPALDKDRQLELFLNRLYFGRIGDRQVHGFAEASRAIFGKPFAELAEDEFIALLAMAPAPNELHPVHDAEANHERAARIRALLSGRCAPGGVLDVRYEACRDA